MRARCASAWRCRWKAWGKTGLASSLPARRWRALADFALPKNVYALGRLDADSEGLLLLGDEPGLNSRLLDPAHGHRRERVVDGIGDGRRRAEVAGFARAFLAEGGQRRGRAMVDDVD